jgi:hypothetical protein
LRTSPSKITFHLKILPELFDIFFLEIYDVQAEIEPERRRATFQIEEARRQFFFLYSKTARREERR